MNFQALMREHDRLGGMAAELERLVAAPCPDMGVLLALRASMSAEFFRHVIHEDKVVYPEMMACGSPDVAETAQRFADEFESLRESWTAYLDEWSPECIAGDWDDFGAETRALTARLRVRIQRENEELYTRALQAGAIRLRA